VLMPFEPKFDWIRGELTRAGQAAGYVVERADDIFTPGVIIEQIEKSIIEADAVIAVCTGRNANVFYELGLAQMVHEAILLAETDSDLPFDIAHRRAIIYGGNPVALATRVSLALKELPKERARRALRRTMDELLTERVVQAHGDDHLYWLTEEGIARVLPNSETASLYTKVRPVANISKAQLDSLAKGAPMTALGKPSLRRSNLDMFALLDGYWHYLTTLAPVYKYGFAAVREVPELSEAERVSHKIMF
jgi:hypothetical protein